MNQETHINWAQCDLCSKWRRLPASFSIEQLPTNWVCSMNPILDFASCDVPEEPYTDIEKPTTSSETPLNDQKQTSDFGGLASSDINSDTTKSPQNGTSEPNNSNNLPLDVEKDACAQTCPIVLDPNKHPILRITDLEIPPLDSTDFITSDFNSLLITADKIELPDISFITSNMNDPNNLNYYQNIKSSPGARRHNLGKTSKKLKNATNDYTKTSQMLSGNVDINDSVDFKNIKYYDENGQVLTYYEAHQNANNQYIKPEPQYNLPSPSGVRKRRSKPGPPKKIKRDLVPPPLVNWVQCEECKKWRQLPSHVKVEHLPEQWYCKMNVWDLPKADCSVPEDAEPIPSNQEFASPVQQVPIPRQRMGPRAKPKKSRREEYVIHHGFSNAYSDTHYIDCPDNETVGGHPVGDRLVVYSHSHSDMTVCRTPEGVEVFSKFPIEPHLDKKRTAAEPLVLSFGCKTDWELETADTIVTERQVELELEKVRVESEKFAANGIEAGRARLLQLCPNLQGQIESRKIIPSSFPEESLLREVKPIKDVPESIHRFVDADETLDKLKTWIGNNNTLVFSPDSQYANMLVCSAIDHPNA